jgi:hypothetical protein
LGFNSIDSAIISSKLKKSMSGYHTDKYISKIFIVKNSRQIAEGTSWQAPARKHVQYAILLSLQTLENALHAILI